MSDMTTTGRVGRITKGPWQMCSDSVYYNKDGPEHRRIATVALYGAPDLEAEANAKAIAALPELVEALTGLITMLDRGFLAYNTSPGAPQAAAVQKAREALKKAGCL